MENKPKLICRKCSGPHLTIKCNQDSKNNMQQQIPLENKKLQEEVKNEKNNNFFHKKNEVHQYTKSNYSSNVNKVKISELPIDISEEELQELLYDWGNIIKITVKKYSDNAVAYVNFKFSQEVDYFVDALNGTNFEYKIIHVEKLDY
jgi:nitrate/nitrite-specific signal transduction histidine kinase